MIYKSPQCFLASLESIGLAVQEKKRKIDFHDGHHGGHLGFPIGMLLAIFDQLAFGVRRKSQKYIFKMAAPWRPSWIYDRHDFSYLIYKSSRCFLASLESTGLSVQEKKRKIDFQDGHHGSHLGFPIRTILSIFDLQVTPMLPTKFQVNWPRGVGGVGF